MFWKLTSGDRRMHSSTISVNSSGTKSENADPTLARHVYTSSVLDNIDTDTLHPWNDSTMRRPDIVPHQPPGVRSVPRNGVCSF
jgi:hypothetical protein